MKKNYQVINFVTFMKKFRTEAKCKEYLFTKKFPEGFVCPRCNHTEYHYKKERELYACKQCTHETSLTAGTVMHRTRTPLVTWFQAIYLMGSSKKGISALELRKKLDVSYWVAWNLEQKIRTAMGKRDKDYQLSGLVAFDDGYVGTPTKGKKRGRGTEKSQVIVGASTKKEEKGTAVYYAKMQVVPDLKEETLQETSTKMCASGTILVTDALPVNHAVEKAGFERISVTMKGVEGKEQLKWVHILISNMKAFLQGTYHGIGKKHLQRYLDEFCYRFNRRFWDGQLFDRLLVATLSCPPTTFRELTQ